MYDLTRYLPGGLEATSAIAGVLGRTLYHFEQVRRGPRPAVGVLLAREVIPRPRTLRFSRRSP